MIKPRKFRSRHSLNNHVVEAMQVPVDEDKLAVRNACELIANWCAGILSVTGQQVIIPKWPQTYRSTAGPGDWVVHNGEKFFIVLGTQFFNAYEEVDATPKEDPEATLYVSPEYAEPDYICRTCGHSWHSHEGDFNDCNMAGCSCAYFVGERAAKHWPWRDAEPAAFTYNPDPDKDLHMDTAQISVASSVNFVQAGQIALLPESDVVNIQVTSSFPCYGLELIVNGYCRQAQFVEQPQQISLTASFSMSEPLKVVELRHRMEPWPKPPEPKDKIVELLEKANPLLEKELYEQLAEQVRDVVHEEYRSDYDD